MLLTNSQVEYTMPEIKMFGLQKYFEKMVISSELGFKKPSKKIFDHALKDFNDISKKEVLYIGDDFDEDVMGALNSGWNVIWLCHDFSKYNLSSEQENKIFKIISELSELKILL